MHPSRLGQAHWALLPTGEGGQPSKPPTRRTSKDAPSPRSRRLSCPGATPASGQCCRQHVLSRRPTRPARTGTKGRDPPAPSVAVNMQTADNHEPSTHVYRRPLIQISRGTGPPAPPAACNATLVAYAACCCHYRSSAPRIGQSGVLPCVAVRHICLSSRMQTQILFFCLKCPGFYFWVCPESRTRQSPQSRVCEVVKKKRTKYKRDACLLQKIHDATPLRIIKRSVSFSAHSCRHPRPPVLPSDVFLLRHPAWRRLTPASPAVVRIIAVPVSPLCQSCRPACPK